MTVGIGSDQLRSHGAITAIGKHAMFVILFHFIKQKLIIFYCLIWIYFAFLTVIQYYDQSELFLMCFPS